MSLTVSEDNNLPENISAQKQLSQLGVQGADTSGRKVRLFNDQDRLDLKLGLLENLAGSSGTSILKSAIKLGDAVKHFFMKAFTNYKDDAKFSKKLIKEFKENIRSKINQGTIHDIDLADEEEHLSRVNIRSTSPFLKYEISVMLKQIKDYDREVRRLKVSGAWILTPDEFSKDLSKMSEEPFENVYKYYKEIIKNVKEKKEIDLLKIEFLKSRSKEIDQIMENKIQEIEDKLDLGDIENLGNEGSETRIDGDSNVNYFTEELNQIEILMDLIKEFDDKTYSRLYDMKTAISSYHPSTE